MFQVPPELAGSWEERVCKAAVDGGFLAVLGSMADFAENQAEWADYTRRAGDQGISAQDVRAWRSIAEKLDAMHRKVEFDLKHLL